MIIAQGEQCSPQIDLPFLGREKELQILHRTYDRLCHGLLQKEAKDKDENRETVAGNKNTLNTVSLIHGDSGTGKSALVNKLLDDIRRREETETSPAIRKHYVCMGKFNESKNSSPFCAIIAALNSLVSSLSKSESDTLRKRVLNLLGRAELNVLLVFLPGLSTFFQPEASISDNSQCSQFSKDNYFESSISSTTNTTYLELSITSGASAQSDYSFGPSFNSTTGLSCDDEEVTNDRITNPSVPQTNVWNRLKYIMYSFMNVIMTMNRPVIMFVDDLQWADKESTDFMKSLLSDNSLTNLMFIGACRENQDRRIDTSIKNIFAERETKFINLNNLSREATDDFVREALNLDADTSKALSNTLYNRTKGNLFFMKQVLEDLVKNKSLSFSRNSESWKLDFLHASKEFLNDNAEISVESKIHRCSEELQKTIIVASAMGCNFDRRILKKVLKETGFEDIAQNLSQILAEAVLEGILVAPQESKMYGFAHDKIFEASFSQLLCGNCERREIQKKVGQTLYEMYMSKESEEWMLHTAATNINVSGCTDIDNVTKAKINLEAGRSSLSMASYKNAESFLMHGVHSLQQINCHWETEYELSLRLLQGWADAKFCLDEEYEGQQCAREVFAQARTIKDKLPTYLSLALFNSRKDNHLQALDTVSYATMEMGHLPKRMHRMHGFRGLLYIKNWYRHHCDDDILKLPLIEDEAKHQKLTLFFNGFSRAGYCGKEMKLILFSVYGLRLSLKYGRCGETALFLGAFANLAMLGLYDYPLAMRFAQLSLKVTRSIPVNNVACWAYFGYCAYFFPWSSPPNDMLLLAQEGYRCAMEDGELDCAATNRYMLSGIAFAAGYPLSIMSKCFEESINQLGIYGIQVCVTQTDEHRQAVYYLTEQLELNWPELESFGPESDIESDIHRLVTGYLMRLMLGVLFRKYEFAEEMAQKCFKIVNEVLSMKMHFIEIMRLCFSFLTKAGLAHRTGKKKYKKSALKLAKLMKACNKSRGDTSYHAESLIDAEVMALTKPTVSNIQTAHKKAVVAALKTGHTYYAALGLELAGEHMLRLGEEELAKQYFYQARYCYQQWGATAKVRQLQLTRILPKDEEDVRPVIPSLSEYFASYSEMHKVDILSLDYRMPERDRDKLFDRLSQK